MKKMLIVLLAGLLVLTAVACKKNEAADVALGNGAGDEPIAGGWTPAADFAVTEELETLFRKGMSALLGVDYVPLAYLGSQVVAGTNHVFLVKGTAVTPETPVSYAFAYFYEDLQGTVKSLGITDLPIVPQGDGTVAPVEGNLSGAWYYAEDPAVTDERQSFLNKALEGMTGANYVPVAYLGEQVVAGLNRCILCQVTPVVPDARPHYSLVFLYTDLQGGAKLEEVIDLDVGSLCTYGG